MKYGEIVEKNGKRYVYTVEGLLPLRKQKAKTIYEDIKTIKSVKTGDKTRVELVKSKAVGNGSERIVYILKKIVTLKDGEVVKSAIGLSEDLAKQIFKL